MNRAAAVLLRQDFAGKFKGLGAEEIKRREKENGIRYEDTLKDYKHSSDHIHKFCLWCRPEDWEAVCATVPGWGAVIQQSAPTDGKIRKWGYLELQPAGCTKGQAIRWWCRRNGIRLKDIAIISPINNTILDYQIKNVLNRNEINVFNTKKNNKIIDYPYSNALVVATCIFYGYEDYIKEDEYISFIEILLNVNRIQAYKIYRNKEVDETYKNLEKYIISKRSENLKISEFLIKFYIDKMLNLKEGIENVDVCKNIIYESEAFIENIKLLGINNNKEEEKVFIEVLKSTINDYYRVSDIADLKESNSIILTTPYSYISYDINRPIQIWVDIGSNAWNMKIEKDISNLIVIRKSFKEKQIYTNEMEEYYKKYYLYNLIYNLLINAKEVYAYKSEYTVNGYIQESILYSILLKLVSKGDV